MADKEPRITTQTAAVLDLLLTSPRSSGADIARATGLQAGTLYPILMRLETAKWLVSEWEMDDPKDLGRPRRRFYEVTALGRSRAYEYGQKHHTLLQRLAARLDRGFA